MFKAKLIESEKYYQIKRRHLLFLFLPATSVWIVSIFLNLPSWFFFLIVGLFVLALIWLFKGQKEMNLISGRKVIEIDDNEIRIKTKSGNEKERFPLIDLEKIIVKEKYAMPAENFKELKNEVLGRPDQNYIILQQKNQQRKFYFEIDSYYMTNQLNEIIRNWSARGLKIEKPLNE